MSITASAAEYDEVGNNIVDIGVDGAAASTAAAAAAVVEVTSEDVIIANGVSGALELALTSLLDDDGVLLVPRPGFPLYKVRSPVYYLTVFLLKHSVCLHSLHLIYFLSL